MFFSFVEILSNRNNDNRVNVIQLVLLLLLIIIVSIRSVGFDYDSYESAYNQLHVSDISDIFSDIQFEPGFILLNKFSPSFIVLIIFMGLITLLIKNKLILNISPFPIVSLMILFLGYYLNFEMGQIRQALAMSITLFSIQYYTDKKKFLFFVLIAILFHYSALIFLLVLIIPTKIKSWYFYVIGLFIAIILFFNIEPVFMKLSDYLPGFSGAKMIGYYDDEKGKLGISIPILFSRFILLSLFFSLKSKIIELRKPIYEYFFNIYFLSLFIYITFAFFPQISGRGGVYFSIFDILLIPIILKAIRNTYYRIAVLFFFTIIYLIMFVSFLNKWGVSFIPYKSWISI